MKRLRALQDRCSTNLKTAFHSWQFWVAEVVGALAVSTASGVIYGPWAAFFASILSLVGITGLVALVDVFPGEKNPKRFALLGGGFCLILASGMAAAYSAGRSTLPATVPPTLVLEAPGPRPDIRLGVESARIDFDDGRLSIDVKNHGDRIIGQGRIVVRPDVNGSTMVSWDFADLAPMETEAATLGLFLHTKDGLYPLERWVDEEGRFSFYVFACHQFHEHDYFTATYLFSCNLPKQRCTYQVFPSDLVAYARGWAGCLELNAVGVHHEHAIEEKRGRR